MAEAQEEALSFNPVEVGDFEEALETANKILVPGVYRTRIVKATHGQGPKSQYLMWQLETLDCQDPEDNGQMLFYITPIEGRGFNIFTDFCQALGVKWEGRQITPEFAESVYGLEVNVETGIEEYEKKPRARVKKIIPASDSV